MTICAGRRILTSRVANTVVASSSYIMFDWVSHLYPTDDVWDVIHNAQGCHQRHDEGRTK